MTKQVDQAPAGAGLGGGRRAPGGARGRRRFGAAALFGLGAMAGCQLVGGFDDFDPAGGPGASGAAGASAGGGTGASNGGGPVAGGGPGAGAAGAGGGACLAVCDGACVDTQSDPAHCGSCETSCQGAPLCDRGQCARFVEVASGSSHSCALADNGSLWCWGRNDVGQLGDGLALDSPTPVRALGVAGAKALALGATHSCALDAAGKAWCWGSTSREPVAANVPQAIGSLDGLTQIDAGVARACARRGDGSAWCWAYNEQGASPYEIDPLAGVVQITTGGTSDGALHACALLDDGASYCWGSNFAGQLGVGSFGDPKSPDLPTPTLVAGGHRFVHLEAGGQHTCAIRDDATVWCWGGNASGQLGNNLTTPRAEPTQVPGLAGATQLSAGEAHTCARLTDGAVWCWGENSAGALGNGTTAKSLVPVKASTATAAAQLSAGGGHACALLADGAAWCWGKNQYGELGDGRSTDKTRPTQVPGVAGVVDVATGPRHACAALADGTAWCWGRNDSGQLGNDSLVGVRAPVQVGGLANVVQVVTTDSASCARRGDGSVWCWGSNARGELGNGVESFDPATTPVRVEGISGAAQLAAGRSYICARRSDGSIWCWGYSYDGPFPSASSLLVPTQIAGAQDIAQLAVHGTHACGVRPDGQGWCWGNNFSIQLGTGAPGGGVGALPPAPVVGVDQLAEIATGGEHTCARRSADKRVWCWGSRFQGQIGDGDTSFGSRPPTLVAGLEGVERIVASANYTCALVAGGALRCWGRDEGGQFGVGTVASVESRPVAAVGEGGFTKLAASPDSLCAVHGDGSLWCWGANVEGKLGLGPSADSPTPLRVFGAAPPLPERPARARPSRKPSPRAGPSRKPSRPGTPQAGPPTPPARAPRSRWRRRRCSRR